MAATAPSTTRPTRRGVRTGVGAAVLAVLAVLVGLLTAVLAGTAPASAAASSAPGGSAPNKVAAADRHTEGPTDRTTSERKFARSLLEMVNKERAANHVAALHMNRHLLLSARRHNLAMAGDNEMSHQVSGEADLGTRETAAGYDWTWAGENIGWNSRMTRGGVLQLETMMYNEQAPNDGHRQNILNPNFTNIGVDVYLDTANHKVWLTTDFGRH